MTESAPEQAGLGSDLVRVVNLTKTFRLRGKDFPGGRSRSVSAVDGVSFEIRKGETLGLVGESGCGKTTTANCIVGLTRPTAGSVLYRDRSVFDMSSEASRAFRRRAQFIFQDPYSSLNPRMTVSRMLEEILAFHAIVPREKMKDEIAFLLDAVGLNARHAHRYPHEFSGGQRQRIGIARALSVKPEFLVCDEPVSALDVSVQAQILNLLGALQEKFSITYLFIGHNLAVVRHVSDRVAVMYLGKIVELADADAIFDKPLHPYTQALISSVPVLDPKKRRKPEAIRAEAIEENPETSGCRFRNRCEFASDVCNSVEPELIKSSAGHLVSCHLHSSITH